MWQKLCFWSPPAGVEDKHTLEEQDDVERQVQAAQLEGPMDPEEHFYSNTEELLTGKDCMCFLNNLSEKLSPEKFVNP